MKSKKLVIGLLLLLAVVFTTGTFAYWASSVTVTQVAVQDETVTIGTGDAVASTVTISNTVSSTDALVPTTITAGDGEVTSVVFTYTVDWTEDTTTLATGTAGTLGVGISNILVGGEADTYSLVNVVVTSGDGAAVSLNDAGTYEVVITVTLDEPANQTEYAAVAGLVIGFDATFTVTVNS